LNRKLIFKAYILYSKLNRLIFFGGYAPLPILIIWEPSYKCNLRCKMCLFYGAGGIVPVFKDEMNFSQIKKIFGKIKKSYGLFLPRIHLTGGEPLIHRHFSDIVAYLGKLGFNYSLTSNFTFLNDKIISTFVKTPPLDLRISLDGPAEIHDKIRGVNGTFDKVMKNIRRIKRAKVSVPIRFNCTICNENIDHLDKMIDIARANGADLNFQHLMFLDEKRIKQHYTFCAKMFKCKPYPIGCPSKLNGGQVNRIIAKIRKIKRIDPDITFLPDLKITEIKDYYLDLDRYVHSPYCSSVWSEARIAPNGQIYPCFDYYFGNLKFSSFNDIWNGKKARRFRKLLKKRKLFPSCVRCCKI